MPVGSVGLRFWGAALSGLCVSVIMDGVVHFWTVVPWCNQEWLGRLSNRQLESVLLSGLL